MKKCLKYFFRKLLSFFPPKILFAIVSYGGNSFLGKLAFFLLSISLSRMLESKKALQGSSSFAPILSGKKFFLSVIIPTYNRSASLQRLLTSLLQQCLENSFYEIIVINNACTDNTHEVCQSFSSFFQNFKEVFEPVPGLLAGRNRGVREACGDVLVFCDDDIEPDGEWLQAIYSIMSSRPDVMLLGGNNRGGFEISPPKFVSDLWTTDSYGIRVNWHYSLVEGIEQAMVAPNHGYVMGCNFTVRREVVEKTRGFGPDCMASILWQGDGENRVGEMAQSMGTVWLDPRVSVTHHMPKSRINQDYLKKRNLYFLISHLYTCLRSGEMPPYESAEAQAYLSAVVKIPELRDWVTKPDYWEAELPPSVELPQIKELLQRHGW